MLREEHGDLPVVVLRAARTTKTETRRPYPVSIERARRRLGWTPRQRLRDALPRMIEHLDRDPRAWYERKDLPIADGARRG